jgi:hypothetical protein
MAIVLEVDIYQNSLSRILQEPRVQSIVCTPQHESQCSYTHSMCHHLGSCMDLIWLYAVTSSEALVLDVNSIHCKTACHPHPAEAAEHAQECHKSYTTKHTIVLSCIGQSDLG